MIRYVRIPSKAPFDLAAFRAKYLELTNEMIQDSIPTSFSGSHLLFASSKISPNVARTLKSLFPKITISEKPHTDQRGSFPEGGMDWNGDNMEEMIMLKKNSKPMSVGDAGELIVYYEDGTETITQQGQWVPEEE